MAGASGSQPRSSAGGLRSLTGCPRADEGDEGTGRDHDQEGLVFRGPRLGRGGVDVDLSVQPLPRRVSGIKQIGPGRVADGKDVDVAWRRAGLADAPITQHVSINEAADLAVSDSWEHARATGDL